jgi:phospholipid/cholesterol/gamma-HCH transport system permease protein
MRDAFRTALTNIITGSLKTVAVTAVIVGIGLVFVPMYRLRSFGQWMSTGRILMIALLNHVTPLLVGIILLGRSGIPMAAEFSGLSAQGETVIPCTESIDPFQSLVLPRAIAFAVAAFMLGVVFLLFAFLSSFAMASLTGLARASVMGFLGNVLRAMSPCMLFGVAMKLYCIGLIVALACSVTSLNPRSRLRLGSLLARTFRLGVTSILVVSTILGIIL